MTVEQKREQTELSASIPEPKPLVQLELVHLYLVDKGFDFK